jgi:hypothetical protein
MVEATSRPESFAPLVESLVRLSGAADVDSIAVEAVNGAADITSARAAAIGVQRGDSVVLLASTGYDCDSMAASAVLPLDAGLPLTECVRTGRTTIHGQTSGATWIAVPLLTPSLRGGLLVSLTPTSSADAAPLEILADATAAALSRLDVQSAAAGASASVVIDAPAWLAAAAHVEPAPGGELVGAGDVVALVPGSRPDISWLVVGDVCGSGTAAAATAADFREAVSVLAGADPSPGGLLTGVDRALRRHDNTGRHVTAAAVRMRLRSGRIQAAIAIAGHPPVLRWRRGEVTPMGTPSVPLNMLPAQSTSYEEDVILELLPGDLLLAYTDGLVERGADDRSDLLVEVFTRAGALGDPDLIVDLLRRAMVGNGETVRDDMAIAVIGLH